MKRVNLKNNYTILKKKCLRKCEIQECLLDNVVLIDILN
jgi:hypothetical protein